MAGFLWALYFVFIWWWPFSLFLSSSFSSLRSMRRLTFHPHVSPRSLFVERFYLQVVWMCGLVWKMQEKNEISGRVVSPETLNPLVIEANVGIGSELKIFSYAIKSYAKINKRHYHKLHFLKETPHKAPFVGACVQFYFGKKYDSRKCKIIIIITTYCMKVVCCLKLFAFKLNSSKLKNWWLNVIWK